MLNFVAIKVKGTAFTAFCVLLTLTGCDRKTPERSAAQDTATVQSSPASGSAASIEAQAPEQERKTTLNDLDPITVAYPSSGVVLGQAYDYVAQRWLPSVCVVGKGVPLGAGEMTVHYKDLQDRQQVFESLKISASGEGSVGVGSASASVDYARSVDIKTERRNILATVDSMKGGEQYMPADGTVAVSLAKAAQDKATLAADATRSPFRAMCGDGYVAAIRKGARMSGVLSFAMDQTDMQESLKASASGGYGPAKAKASMERIRNDKTDSLRTDMNMLQVGGNRTANPITAQEFIDKLKTFGAYTEAEAVPLEVVVLPYRVLGDIPPAVRERPLPDLGVRGLAAHYWRLSDLSSLYARASMNSNAYYHPFVPPAQLVSKARVLQNAALCVSEMLDICNVEGTQAACSLETLTKRATVRKVCLQDDPSTTLGERIESTELAVGSRRAGALLNEDRAFKTGPGAAALQKWNEGVRTASALSTPAMASAPSSSSADTKTQANARWNANTYDLWFRNFARAPWPRQVNASNTALEGADMNILLGAFCVARGLNCTNAAYDRLSGKVADVANVPDRNVIFREFVVATRLFPVAAAVCNTLLSHPMCQLPDVLYFYVNDLPGDDPLKLAPEREFRPLAVPPTAEIQIPKAREPRPPRSLDCKTRVGGPGAVC